MLRKGLLSLDILLLLLFALGYAAAYVHPRYVWWLQLIALFLPYLSIAVLTATVIALQLGWWKLLGLHLIICLLILIRFISIERMLPRHPDNEQKLTVMTFNGPYRYPKDEPTIEEARLAYVNAMVPLIQKAEPDLIALQGVTLRFQDDLPNVQSYLHILGLMESGYESLPPRVFSNQTLFQPVLARVSMKERGGIGIRTKGGSWRIYGSVTVFYWQDQEVSLYNLHLRAYNSNRPWRGNPLRWLNPRRWPEVWRAYREDFVVRAREAEQIRQLIRNERRPYIVCGDFNDTPHNWAYRHIAQGLTDSYHKAGRGWGGTYHSRLPLVRIDHILVSPHWKVYEALSLEVDFSDHRPLTTTVSLKN